MTTREETIREAAEVMSQLIGSKVIGNRRVTQILAQLLADAGLLRQEMTEEYVPADGFGEPETWRGLNDTYEEAAACGHVACCGGKVLRRYVTEWVEVPDGGV